MSKINTIGLLTSGGDAPGMNAAIRAVTRAAIYNGWKVKGIYRGWEGLINNEIKDFTSESVSGTINRGGTILRTARSKGFMSEEGRAKAYENLKAHGIDALIVIGGNGSLAGAQVIASEYDIPCVGLPGTIDNDLEYTDYTLGFDTAVNTCLDIINKLRDTMTSHERVSVVEVMGRHCGDIALYSGIASGAEIIVVPELPFDMNEIASRINRSRAQGKHSNIIVIAEGVMSAEKFASQLQQVTEYSVRPTCIGHVQRGGSPTMSDRMLAAQFGNKAVRLLNEGIGNRVVGIRDNKIMDMDIIEAVSMKKTFNYELYETLQMISM